MLDYEATANCLGEAEMRIRLTAEQLMEIIDILELPM